MTTFYMPVINTIKVGAIWLTDLINLCYDPFGSKTTYDTPAQDLNNLATLFNADLEARFMQPTGEFLYESPRPIDAGDTALFQGLSTGMKIMQGNDVSRELDFIRSLFPNNRLIRGYWNDGRINDTTSNDSVSGMVFFFYAALRYGWPSLRVEASNILLPWLRQLKADNWALCDQAGNPTTYGKLDNGVMTDPLRITILLALLALSTGYSSHEFTNDYLDLYNKYKGILAYPKVKLLWLDTAYDTHRAAISLHALYYITNDKRYKKGLQRIWRISKKGNNAWVYTLCHSALDDKSEDGIVKTMLSTFDFAKRQLGNVQAINDDQPAVNWPPKLPFDITEPKVRSKYPLSLDKRGSQDFFWQRNMNSLNDWVGVTSPYVYHSGLDFLICFNLAKREGLL